jgi:hypothetical protein
MSNKAKLGYQIEEGTDLIKYAQGQPLTVKAVKDKLAFVIECGDGSFIIGGATNDMAVTGAIRISFEALSFIASRTVAE